VEERIAGLDVGQERVAEALAFGGPLHKSGDVDHIQEGRNFAEN
jgi:hypothetical protein